MQVSIESTGPLEKTMRVEIPEERIANEVQNRLQNLSKTTRVQGFRPGKVPIKVIQQRFGPKVRQEVIGEVVQSSFYEAISKENLRPAGNPLIDPLDAIHGRGLSYTAKFEVFPEVELTSVDELEIEKTVCDINDDDIDKMIEVLRKQRRKPVETDRAANSGDLINIDFVGKINEASFEGGAAENFNVEIGTGRLIEGFEEGLIGKQGGDEVTLSLAFPEEYQNRELAGKPVVFDIKVNSVSELVLPELDEEFFTAFGVKEGGEDALRKEISEHMDRECEGVIRNRHRESVMDALYNATEIPLPNALVENEKHRLQHQFKDNLKAQGIELPADNDKLTDPGLFEEQAKKRVALQLIISEIIRQHELKAEPDKIRAMIEKNAGSFEDPSAIVNWYYEDKQRLAEVEALVLEDEVIDWISRQAKTREVKMSFDDLMNKGQTEAG